MSVYTYVRVDRRDARVECRCWVEQSLQVNPHAIKEFSQQHRSRVFHDFFQEFQAEHGEAHTDLGMKSDGTSSATPTHGRARIHLAISSTGTGARFYWTVVGMIG
eukprot:31440-Pelagococcus_subviridis.AAC.22